MVATNPMVSSTTVLRCLELLSDSASKISQSKARLVSFTEIALLYDSTLEFPGEWSTQQLPNSGRKNKRPSAWAEFHEEERQ
jgi:hypothetical protein